MTKTTPIRLAATALFVLAAMVSLAVPAAAQDEGMMDEEEMGGGMDDGMEDDHMDEGGGVNRYVWILGGIGLAAAVAVVLLLVRRR